MPGLFAAPKRSRYAPITGAERFAGIPAGTYSGETLKAAKPGLSERLKQRASDALASVGVDRRTANRVASKVTAFVSDVTPVGDAVTADEAGQAFKAGNPLKGLGLGALAMLGAVPGIGDGAAKGIGKLIRAWHGSPHDFDRFDISKIGTGEGAQAYGHGLYFAENPEVATDYRRGLSGPDSYLPAQRGPAFDAVSKYLSDGKSLDWAKRLARQEFEDDLRLANDFIEMDPKGSGQWQDTIQSAQRGLADLDQVGLDGFTRKEAGRLYEVNINADPDSLLDWEKKLGDQPGIAEAVNQLDLPLVKAWQDNGAFPHVSGQTLYRQMADGLTRGAADKGMHRVASSQLRDVGIPGLRYFDQGSRGSGQGTRNYVIFDDSLVDIVGKY